MKSNFHYFFNILRIFFYQEVLKQLNNQISPFILRRRKKDVLKDLPSKIENNVYIELNEDQKKVYVAQLEQTKKQIDEAIGKEGFMKSQILILSLRFYCYTTWI